MVADGSHGCNELVETNNITEVKKGYFAVVHPLDDVPEAKVETSRLGPMPLTSSVKMSLMALRGYLS